MDKQNLANYELIPEKDNHIEWETITRMVNNPYNQTFEGGQGLLDYNWFTGRYLVRTTESKLDTMKKIVKFKSIRKID